MWNQLCLLVLRCILDSFDIGKRSSNMFKPYRCGHFVTIFLLISLLYQEHACENLYISSSAIILLGLSSHFLWMKQAWEEIAIHPIWELDRTNRFASFLSRLSRLSWLQDLTWVFFSNYSLFNSVTPYFYILDVKSITCVFWNSSIEFISFLMSD